MKTRKEIQRLKAMVARFHGELKNVKPTPECKAGSSLVDTVSHSSVYLKGIFLIQPLLRSFLKDWDHAHKATKLSNFCQTHFEFKFTSSKLYVTSWQVYIEQVKTYLIILHQQTYQCIAEQLFTSSERAIGIDYSSPHSVPEYWDGLVVKHWARIYDSLSSTPCHVLLPYGLLIFIPSQNGKTSLSLRRLLILTRSRCRMLSHN